MYIYREMATQPTAKDIADWSRVSGINDTSVTFASVGVLPPPDHSGTLPVPSAAYAASPDGGGYAYGLEPHLPPIHGLGDLESPGGDLGGNIENLLAPPRTGCCNVGELEAPPGTDVAEQYAALSEHLWAPGEPWSNPGDSGSPMARAREHSESEQREKTAEVIDRLAEFKAEQAQLLGMADYRQYGDDRGIVYYVGEAEAGEFANALNRFEQLRDHIARLLYGKKGSTIDWTGHQLKLPKFRWEIARWAIDEDGMGRMRDDGHTELSHDFSMKAHWFAHAKNGGDTPSPCNCGKSCKVTSEGIVERCTCAADADAAAAAAAEGGGEGGEGGEGGGGGGEGGEGGGGGGEFFQSRRRYRRT